MNQAVGAPLTNRPLSTPAPKVSRSRKVYQWQFRPDLSERAREFEQALRLSPAVARVIANRGLCETADQLQNFLRPALATIHDPFLLTDMEAAVRRVAQAREAREHVTVYGDYDSDGTTSTALLLRVLRFLGLEADFYIPHRLEEGYGLHVEALERIAASGTRLLITVDTGISAVAQVAHARALGMDVIVTDHHQPGEQIPDTLAVINPNRRDCPYPNKGLAGVGVAFKFAHALLKGLGVDGERAKPFLMSLLDLVAIGSIADSVPLTGENRVLVARGLDQMARSANAGVVELLRLVDPAGLGKRVSSHKIGFQIAPRLNAAGRTDSARVCVELLTTDDPRVAASIAARLDQFNRERRTVESRIFEQCLRFLESNIDLGRDRVVVVNGADWHLGVIGIVASKIVEMVDRPVIILSEQKGHAKGSARSTRGFNIHEALMACREHLTAFGGHPSAAGLQLALDRIADFRQAINEYADTVLSETDLEPTLLLDTEVEGHELDQALVRDLSLLEPFGHQNPAPLFALRHLQLADAPRVVGTNHLKLQFRSQGRILSAIGFNMGGCSGEIGTNRNALFDVAFVPTLNSYWNPPRVELEMKDLKICRPV